MENEVKIQAYSKKQLADMYNVSVKCLRRWLEPFTQLIGEYKGKAFTPKQIETIFDKIGKP